MRPSLSEQLDGLARILDEVVGPHLDDPYAADILDGAGATLRALATAWHQVPAYLRWDTEVTAELLRAARPHLDPALGDRIDEALSSPPSDPLDVLGLESAQVEWRALLAESVPALGSGAGAADVRRRIADHMLERAERFPIVVAHRPPHGLRGGAAAPAN